MRERAAKPRVLFAVRVDDRGRYVADDPVERGGLGHLRRAALGPDAVAVDVLPRPRVGEGEVAGADADDGPVPVVQLLGVEGLGAGGVPDGPGERRRPVQLRPGELVERVEEEVVDDRRRFIRDDLYDVSL